MKLIPLALAALMMCGCQNEQPKLTKEMHWTLPTQTISPACSAKWVFKTTEIGKEWNYVGNDDRIYATVDLYWDQRQEYTVWHNGAGYGDYVSLTAAKKHAEEIACTFKENTF